jgi:parvulin-like peptidyl-prolyl isomerase
MKLNFFVFFLLFISAKSFSQKDNDVLAKIGDKVITVDEFKYRYEFTPQINRKNSEKSIQRSKEEFLYTLIAEDLFAEEAEKLGYDTTESMKMNFIPMEKMQVRDALYKKEIKNLIKLDDKKITEGLWLSNNKLFVDYLYSHNKDSIDFAYQELKKSSNFDSTVALLKNIEYVKEPYEVTYGKMFPEPEKEVFALKINEYTKPQQSPDGWYIFRLLSQIPVEYKTADQKMSLVKKTVESRTEDSLYNSFYTKFFKDKHVTTDGNLFWSLVDSTQKLIEEIKTRDKIKDNDKIILSSDDLVRLKNSFPQDSLKKTFIKFAENPVSFNDFLNEFLFEGFYTFTTDKRTIANQINSRVKRQIELEMLARYGYEQGLESLNEVRSSTEIWKNNYLATLFRKDQVLNTKLSDTELNNIMQQKGDTLFNDIKVNIVELLTDSLDIVKQALPLADNTEEFKKFAANHTKRNEFRENRGESGFFSTTEFGEIGKIAGTMEVGDVYGPLQVDNCYSIFKLIDKKEQTIDKNNQQNIDEIKGNILYSKALNNLENTAANLADKYGVTINEKLLNSVQVNNMQMIVFRYMGFGGRILAFPYTAPFYKWKDNWEQKKKEAL